MIFTSITFLVFYLLLLCFLYFIKNNNMRLYILLGSSYIFYGWWNPVFIVLIVASSLWSWYLGLLMDRATTESKKIFYLSISIVLSISMLVYYKYTEFLLENLFSLIGYEWESNLGIILPVGISFFTFQTMSYSIDLKRGNIPVCKSLPKYMLFVAFFPQLVAGPIVRATEFIPQLSEKIKITLPNLLIGGQLFLGGAIQKVIFSDNLSSYADTVFSQPELFSTGTLWLSAIAYAMQIFCDFSGYSLMAIGIAKTLGFHLPENFRMPYISLSVTEFWRRWHKTLSFWLRDYLYISLGGNRKGKIRQDFNLLITMVLGGLWHGASWNFVIWGSAHGLALIVHKFWEKRTMSWCHSIKKSIYYKVIAWASTFIFVLLLWIPFRAENFTITLNYFIGMFSFSHEGISWINPNILVVLLCIIFWHFLFIVKSNSLLQFPLLKLERLYPQLVISITILALLLFVPLNSSPFIYFQF